METRVLRVLLIIVQFLIYAVCLTACVFGILQIYELKETYVYISSIARIITLILVTVSYYKNSFSTNNPGDTFTTFFLFFASLAEVRVISYFSAVTGWGVIPDRASVLLLTYAIFMTFLSAIGYGLYFHNNEHTAISRFMFMCTFGTVFLVYLIPSSQNVTGIWKLNAPFYLLTIFLALAVLSHLILIMSDTTRQLGSILMLVGLYMNVIAFGFNNCIISKSIYVIGG
ncbi:MAG: hypothetical protein HUK24_08940, partial [Sphaerochaetaceae bacterium]|nr:hypothetical protein [Sphaerochaetaceae bacterium]